jgi:hypothetical protein
MANHSELVTEQGREREKIKSVASDFGKTAYPCEVLAVTTRTENGRVAVYVDIAPQIHQLSHDDKPIEHATIYNVPALELAGGKCAIILKPQVGDVGVALICHADISGFKNSSGRKSPPVSNRHNSYSDSIYLGCLYRKEASTFMVVEDDKITITGKIVNINADTVKVSKNIEIGGSMTVAKNISSMGMVTNMGKNIGATHTHIGVMPGNGVTGVVL